MLKKTSPMRVFRNSLLIFLLTAAGAHAEVPVVRQSALHKIEPDSYGLEIVRSNDFLNAGMWDKTAFGQAVSLIRAMKPVSLTATALQRGILLATARPPAFTPKNEWLTVRMEKLFEWGLFDDVVQLGEKIPENLQTEKQRKIISDALLLTDFQRACAGRNGNPEQVRLLCEALNGNEDEVFRLSEIVGEQGGDAYVLKAADAFFSKTPFSETPPAATAPNIAAARLAGVDFSSLIDDNAALWVKKAYVETTSIPAEKRLPVAENLAQQGLLNPVELRTLYDETSFLTGDLEHDFAEAERRKAAAAFAAATKDLWENQIADADILPDSLWRIKGFMAANLPEKAKSWVEKAELTFPDSPTVVQGWAYAELQPETERCFMPFLELMIRADVPAERIDAIMAVYTVMNLVPNDEYWNLSTLTLPSLPERKGSAAEQVLKAIAGMTERPDGLLQGLGSLQQMGFEREALRIAVETEAVP